MRYTADEPIPSVPFVFKLMLGMVCDRIEETAFLRRYCSCDV